MTEFTQDWFSMRIPKWQSWLEKFKDQPNLTFLEVGCFEGRATLWLLENILTDSSSLIICIDTFEGSPEHKLMPEVDFKESKNKFLSNIKPYLTKVKLLEDKSEQILREFSEQPLFSFIYIDGAHVAKNVLQDIVLTWPLLKSGGIVIFDDYEWNFNADPKLNPKMAIDAFLSIYENEYTLIENGYQLCIQKN